MRDSHSTSPEGLHVIHPYAALPDAPLATQRLIDLAEGHNARGLLRDAALHALGRLDAGQCLATLLDALHDDRGRIAIYALRHVLLTLPPAQALAQLRRVPSHKVTVAKEVVRLLGELHTEEAYAELLAWHDRDVHRDVRLALLGTLWEYQHDDRTWQIFAQAAVDPDPTIATAVCHVPTGGLAPANQQRLATLLTTLMRHPDVTVRCESVTRCVGVAAADADHILRRPLLAALTSAFPNEVTHAAAAIFATYVGREAAAVGAVLRELLPYRQLYAAGESTTAGRRPACS